MSSRWTQNFWRCSQISTISSSLVYVRQPFVMTSNWVSSFSHVYIRIITIKAVEIKFSSEIRRPKWKILKISWILSSNNSLKNINYHVVNLNFKFQNKTFSNWDILLTQFHRQPTDTTHKWWAFNETRTTFLNF